LAPEESIELISEMRAHHSAALPEMRDMANLWQPIWALLFHRSIEAMSQDELLRLDWRKAKRSMSNGNCTEVAFNASFVAVRDSKDPYGPVQRYSTGSWRIFVQEAKTGKFDFPYI
jgi:hypothetical protein